MDAMSSQKRNLAAPSLLQKLQGMLPSISFVKDSSFLWSPSNQTIHYPPEALSKQEGQARIIHEFGHALLGHTTYQSDFELIKMEVDAWQQAKQIASKLKLELDQDFIEDCLDTYRDWLHRRSTCPRCSSVSLQQDYYTYSCHNCSNRWNVSAERFHRPYRMQAQPI